MTGPVLRYPFNALVSFHYYKRDDLARLTTAGLRLIGDSGAFSASTQGSPIDLAEYADWVVKWTGHLCWAASLDVIGNADASWANYRRLRDKHGLDVVPTIHAGADKRLLDRYVADGVDFVGLGGLVAHRTRPDATLPWLVDVMRYARDKHPQVRFHGWGVTNPRLILSLPWYSVDSSNLGQPYRYARASLFHPPSARWVRMPLDGHSPRKHDDMLRRFYGVAAADMLLSVPANRRLLVRVSGRSYQLVEDYLRHRHGVITAPAYGISDDYDGHAHHAATTSTGGLADLGATGPAVHATTGNAHDSLTDLTDPSSGPAVHAGTGDAYDALVDLSRSGPAVHAADTDPGTLRAAGRLEA